MRNNLLGDFHKPQNLSYKESNKPFSSLEKVSISHDNDTTMEPRETLKKQSTNRGNEPGLSKRGNSKSLKIMA